MSSQGIEIYLAFPKLLHLFRVRSDSSERSVEKRDTPGGSQERRHPGKGKEGSGMGRSEMIAKRNIGRKHLAQIETVEVEPVALLQGLQHDAKGLYIYQTKRQSVVGRGVIEHERK